MAEEPKRLTPTNDVVRELYLKSGNQCAFPGCDHLIMDKDGVLIAEMYHIEAALPDGERFNKNQTNEERRLFGNLMLMCHAHHKVTDNVNEYTVERLKKIKADHEAKFTDVVSKIQNSIIDHTTLNPETLPATLNRLNEILKWNHGREELNDCLEEVVDFAQRLKKMPLRTRKLLLIMLERSHKAPYDAFGLEVSVPEIMEACHLDGQDFWAQISILDKYNLVSESDPDDYGVPQLKFLYTKEGWPIWGDLKKYSKITDISSAEFIENLRFDLLD